MKVCTDSCLFGAWIADKIYNKIINPEKILDIGSGTGLLSLMLAQKSNSQIDAIEIDKNSFEQSKENFAVSTWVHRLNCFNEDIKEWKNDYKYDLIISNPPFFENDLKSIFKNKNIAKHNDSLTLKELIDCIKNKISEEGKLAILLPYHRIEHFENIAAEHNFYLEEKLLVKQSPKHFFFRGILLFGKQMVQANFSEITIKNEGGLYTSCFSELLKDYYLK